MSSSVGGTGGTGGSGAGGGNPLSGLGDMLGLGGGFDYDYNGSFRQKYGESLFTDEQKKLQAERNAELLANQMQFASRYSAAERANIDRSLALTGGKPVTPSATPGVQAQFAPKANLQLSAGVPVKV